VLDLYCDAEGRIWVSTWSAGITIIDFQKPKLKFIQHLTNNDNSIRSSQVNAIFEDSDGDLWFGTNSGVSILSKSTNRWSHLLNVKNSKEISTYKIITIGEDNRRRIWIGGYANGVHCYDKSSGTLTDFTAKVGTHYPYITYYDDDNNMWFGGMEGLLTKMNLTNNTFSQYKVSNVTVAINKNKDQLWVATTSGLCIIDKTSDKVIPYSVFACGLNEISNKYINCLFQDKTERLWIGTNGGGLNMYDPNKGQIEVYSTAQGLPSNFIYCIYSDKIGRIWLSTEKGICCFDPVSKNSIDIGYIAKFTDFPFNPNAHANTKSGDIVLGGLNGAVVFTPELIQPYTSKSKLVINEFRISYQRVLPGEQNSPLKLPANLTSEIKLNYGQNFHPLISIILQS
jgi:ligand-binding sensor domain-containing protein